MKCQKCGGHGSLMGEYNGCMQGVECSACKGTGTTTDTTPTPDTPWTYEFRQPAFVAIDAQGRVRASGFYDDMKRIVAAVTAASQQETLLQRAANRIHHDTQPVADGFGGYDGERVCKDDCLKCAIATFTAKEPTT